MQSRKKKLVYNTTTFFLYEIVMVICGLILPRLMLGRFGSEANGLVSSIKQFLSVFAVGEMGIGAVVQTALYSPLAAGDEAQISRVLKSARRFFNKLTIGLAVYVLVLAFAYPAGVLNSFPYSYTFLLVLAIAVSEFGSSYLCKVDTILLSADQKNYIPVGISILTLIISTVISALMIEHGYSIQAIKLSSSVFFLLKPIVLYLYVSKKYNIDRRIVLDTEPIPQKWNGIAQHVSYIILSNTDVVVLTMLSTLTNVSIYGIYNLAISGIKQVVVAVSNSFRSLLGSMLARSETKALHTTFEMFEWLMHTVVTLLFTITGILIVPFVSVYTRGINDANYIVPLFAAIMTVATASYCIRLPYSITILAAGHFKQTQTSCIVEAAINVLVSVILVRKFGLVGVAIGTLAAMAYRTVYLVLYLTKNIIFREFKYFIKHIFVDLVAVAAMIASTFWISLGEVSYAGWVVMALKVSLICIVILLIVNIFFHMDKIKETTRIIRKKHYDN